jgi:glycosyltransferase involved in cell wall biosynthesis
MNETAVAHDTGVAQVLKPAVSVIIATRNRAVLLTQTLDALARQTWPHDRLEIIVADNGSTDGTRAAVEAAAARPDAPAVRYLSVANPGKSFAVNAAFDRARGDILAFTDDDVLPEPDWIARLSAAFAETGADFVAGRILPRWEASPPSWLSPALYGVLAIPDGGDRRQAIPSPENAVMPIGANMAVRARVVARVGGLRTDLGKLDGTLRTGEDHEFFLRMLDAGFRGTYEPTAVVHHWVPRDRLVPRYFRRWMHQNGRDVAQLTASGTQPFRRLFGVPLYLWRETAWHAWRAIRGSIVGDRQAVVASALRVVWFAGYLREAIHMCAGRLTSTPGEPIRLTASAQATAVRKPDPTGRKHLRSGA